MGQRERGIICPPIDGKIVPMMDFTRRRKRRKFGCMRVALPEPEIVTRKGKPVSVIIPIKDYQELLERLEDAEDEAWLKRVRRKPLHYRPLEDYLSERNRK
jgi:hypothetical protein